MEDIRAELDVIFRKENVTAKVTTQVQPHNDNIIKTALYLNGVLVANTRRKNREKEPPEDGEVLVELSVFVNDPVCV